MYSHGELRENIRYSEHRRDLIWKTVFTSIMLMNRETKYVKVHQAIQMLEKSGWNK